MGVVVRIVLHIAMAIKVYWDTIILKQMFNHNKNYTELRIKNYFLRKSLNLIKTTYKYSLKILHF